MVFFKTLLFIILICIHFTWTTEPRAYYISPSGNDQFEGSISKPFKTIQRLKHLPLNPGDSILFEGGGDYTGTLQLDTIVSGNRLQPIVISVYGKGVASIRSGNEPAIQINKVEWLTLRKLKLIGAGRKTGNVHDGLSILNSDHIVIDSLDISGFQKAGLHIGFSENISITNVYAHENGFAGISVEGKDGFKKSNHNIYIAHCLAENNPGDPSNLDNHSGNGIVVSNCTNTLIEYCTATNNGWDMPRQGNGPVGIWAFEADSVTIQHCLSYRNKTSVGGADGGGFDFDGGVTNSIVQYCLSYGNQGAGYCIFQYLYASPWHDNIFRYNISENDGTVSDAQAGIYVWNSSLDSGQFYNCLVYNNTIYNSKVAAISYSELSRRKGFSFYNNIFVGKDSLIKGNRENDIFIANDWWSLENNADASGLTKIFGGFHVNPGFKKGNHAQLKSVLNLKSFDQYKIPVNSPLRNQGKNLQSQFGIETGHIDFNGGKAPVKGIGASF